MTKISEIRAWQQRFFNQPIIWTVITNREGQLGHLYDSKEAAEVEAEWHRKRGTKFAEVRILGYTHSLELSQERWK